MDQGGSGEEESAVEVSSALGVVALRGVDVELSRICATSAERGMIERRAGGREGCPRTRVVKHREWASLHGSAGVISIATGSHWIRKLNVQHMLLPEDPFARTVIRDSPGRDIRKAPSALTRVPPRPH
jgi:hypothetical protein